jgi:hypothetical protein
MNSEFNSINNQSNQISCSKNRTTKACSVLWRRKINEQALYIILICSLSREGIKRSTDQGTQQFQMRSNRCNFNKKKTKKIIVLGWKNENGDRKWRTQWFGFCRE